MNLPLRHRGLLLAAGLALAGAAAAFWWITEGRSIPLDQGTPAVTFVVLFVLLPLIGFPISLFLILLGVKFDPAPALLIMFGAMAVHQVITFLAGKALLRPFIEKTMANRRLSLPRFPAEGHLWPSIGFMALPGLSYTMKNYVLSLSGIPFRSFFPIAWLVQAVRGIPMVLAGGTLAGGRFGLLPALVGLVGVFFLFRFWRVRRRGSVQIKAGPLNGRAAGLTE